MSADAEVVTVILQVARALERAGVDYLVGGSVASSAYGEPRATRDLDVAVRLAESKVPEVTAALGPDFAVDEQAVREAVRQGRSANIFYLPMFMKVDLFMRGQSAYDEVEFSRRTPLEPLPGERVYASSVEDNLLWKLRWYRLGSESSDQQWRDILGILRISGDSLEVAYLEKWAAYHGVADLLTRALNQAAAGS